MFVCTLRIPSGQEIYKYWKYTPFQKYFLNVIIVPWKGLGFQDFAIVFLAQLWFGAYRQTVSSGQQISKWWNNNPFQFFFHLLLYPGKSYGTRSLLFLVQTGFGVYVSVCLYAPNNAWGWNIKLKEPEPFPEKFTYYWTLDRVVVAAFLYFPPKRSSDAYAQRY